MSTDDELREELHRLAAEIVPDTEVRLVRAVRQGRRRQVVTRSAIALGVAAAVATVIAVPVVLNRDSPRSDLDPAATVSPSTGSAMPPGRFSAMSQVVPHALRGAWSLQFESDGRVVVSAPDGFDSALSGYTYVVDGDQIRTDLLITSPCDGEPPATYAWRLEGARLTFTTVDESCAAREALLTSQPWTRQ
jgi:hypothetical protein